MAEGALSRGLVDIKGFLVGGDLWFEPRPGLNVVYGKNGVGKSTLVNYLDAISGPMNRFDHLEPGQNRNPDGETMRRTPTERGEGRVIVRFVAPFLLEAGYRLAEDVRTAERGRELVEPYGRRSRRKLGSRIAELLATGSGGSRLEDDDEVTTQWSGDRFYDAIVQVMDVERGEIRTLLEAPSDDLELDDDDPEGWYFRALLELAKDELRGKKRSVPVRDLADGLRRTVARHYLEWDPAAASVDSINERLATYGIEDVLELDAQVLTKPAIDDLNFRDLFLLYVDVIICRLQYELNDAIIDVETWYGDEHGRLGDFNDADNPLTFSAVRDDADNIIEIVARAIHEQQVSPLVSYEQEALEDGHSARLLIPTGEETGEWASKFARWRQSWRVMARQEEISLEDQVLNSWIYDSLVVSPGDFGLLSVEDEFVPYFELPFAIGDNVKFPFEVFRLDEDFSVQDVLAEIASETIGRDLFEAIAVADEDQFGDDLEAFVQPLNDVLAPVSGLLSSFGIGVSEIRARASTSIDEWVSGTGISWGFVDSNSRLVSQSFANLSSAQRYWVKAAMVLVAAKSADGCVLVVGDEPDRSLHERAAFNVMEVLSKSGVDVIVSSHSVSSLRTRRATLHHLEIGADGHRRVSEVAVGDDVLVAAERLGTTPYDLLSLKRMMVLVEGSHDAAVVNHLLNLSSNSFLTDRVLVAPMRGVKNVASVADSVLVTEFSDLNILAIVDNGRNEVFTPILEELRQLEANGATEAEMKRLLASRRNSRTGQDASFEERILFDLLERAIHRGVLRRLDIFALSVGDVIELLPPGGLGLADSLDWKHLRKEYRNSHLRTDFKSWLKDEHGVSVSVRSIERAFNSMDSLHPELTRLLQQIELGCSTS